MIAFTALGILISVYKKILLSIKSMTPSALTNANRGMC